MRILLSSESVKEFTVRTTFVLIVVVIIIIIIIILFTAIGLSPGGSGYFTCVRNMNLVTTTRKFKSGGLHEKHVVATWNLGIHLSTYF